MQAELEARAEAARQQAAQAAAENQMAPAGAMAYAAGEGAARMPDIGVDPENPETWRGTGRNQPCPCGSGKKYKHCHGRL